MAVLFNTNFDSDTIGAWPAGFTQQFDRWLVQTAGAISGTKCIQGIGNGDKLFKTVISQADFEAEYRYTLPASGGWDNIGVIGRWADATTNGILVFTQGTVGSAAQTVYIFRQTASNTWSSVYTSGSITILGTPVAGSIIRVFVKMVGTQLTLVMMVEGQTKPTSGTGFFTYTAGTVYTGAGTIGLYKQTNSAPLDDFAIDDLTTAAVPVNTVAPSISGATTQGALLTCDPGTWTNSPTSYTYQWYRAGSVIDGATNSTYSTVVGDVGSTITCLVAGVNATGTGTAVMSAAIGPITSAAITPTNATLPVITGTTVRDSVLSGSNGTWNNGPTSYAYRWFRNGSPIGGATSNTYTLVTADVGATITFGVIATNAAGSSTEAVSAGVGPVTAPGSAIDIPVTNTVLDWAPASWDHLPIGQYGVSIASKQTGHSNAYLRFSVGASTDVSILIDESISAGLSAGQKPSVAYMVDEGILQTVQITSGQTSIPLVAGGSSKTRTFELWFLPIGSDYDTSSQTPGQSLRNGIRIQGVRINSGASIAAYPKIAPKAVVCAGDSITQGIRAGSDFGAAVTGSYSPMHVYVPILAAALNAKYGCHGFGSQGWTVNGSAGAPFPQTWNKYAIDRPRDMSGLDYFTVMHGANDSDSVAVNSAVTAWLPLARAGLGATCWIIVFTPVGGRNASAIINAVNAYKLANPSDTKTLVIDLSTRLQTSLFPNGGQAVGYASDGLHPNKPGQALIGGVAAGMTLEATTTGGGEPVPNPLWTDYVEGTTTYQKAMQAILAAQAGLSTVITNPDGSQSVKFKARDGVTDRISAEVTGRSRTAVILN